jgi:histidinol phosphatase-like PHP family hydrolase
MYNLHTHTLLSDGALLPSEVAVRYSAAGYKAIAITDHTDYCNIKSAVSAITDFCMHWPKGSLIKVLPGIELTHLPCEQFKPLTKYARAHGIKVIIAHGETPVEPVIPGTNRAALLADIDILAHPGKISDEDAKLAAERGVFLELTSRSGHSETNSFVASQAKKFGARLILNHDSHEPEDIISPKDLEKVGDSCGLNQADIDKIYRDVEAFLKTKEGR